MLLASHVQMLKSSSPKQQHQHMMGRYSPHEDLLRPKEDYLEAPQMPACMETHPFYKLAYY